MFSNEPRCIYRKNQLAEVICQLRFPEILKISAEAPVAFQEAIRDEYPQYVRRNEPPMPRLPGAPVKPEKAEPVINHQFTSADGLWRVNMTSKFISLSCAKYTRWEDLAQKLDKPLVAFIRTYHPAYFERVGLRYVNFFSRRDLGLEEARYSDLFAPWCLGPLVFEEIQEPGVTRCGVDADIPLRHGCRAKIHAGPGMVRRNGRPDAETKFVFDQDLYMQGNIPIKTCVGALQTLHIQADSIFRGAITDVTHDAMEPRRI